MASATTTIPPTAQDIWEQRSLDARGQPAAVSQLTTATVAPWSVLKHRRQVGYTPDLSFDIQWRFKTREIPLKKGQSDWELWGIAATFYNGAVSSWQTQPPLTAQVNRWDLGVTYALLNEKPRSPVLARLAGFTLGIQPLRWDRAYNGTGSLRVHPKSSEVGPGFKINYLPLQLTYSYGFLYSRLWYYGFFMGVSTARPLPIVFRYGIEVGLCTLEATNQTTPANSVPSAKGTSAAGQTGNSQK